MVLALAWFFGALIFGITFGFLFSPLWGGLVAALFLISSAVWERFFKIEFPRFGPLNFFRLGVITLLLTGSLSFFSFEERAKQSVQKNSIRRKPVSIEAYVDKTKVRVERDKLIYTLIVRYYPQIKIVLPKVVQHPAFNGPFVIPSSNLPKITEKKLDDGRIEKRWELTLIAVMSGPLEIPSFEVTYWYRGKKRKLSSPTIDIEVGELGDPSQILKGLAGPKSPVVPELPFGIPEWVWWSAAIFASLAAALSLLFWLNRQHYTPPPLPPELWFEEELKKLRGKNYLKRGELKEHYFALSELFRGYLERRFLFPALERTTEELIAWSKETEFLKPETARRLRKVLSKMDEVKFAGERPSPKEVEQLEAELLELVREMSPPPSETAGAEKGEQKKR